MKNIMKSFKILITLLLFIFLGFFIAKTASADAVIENALNYLKSQQDATGRITNGFSVPSQWSTIAFAANGLDVSFIKNPSVSLQDFLTTNVPGEPSSATDWETRILAIVATGGDPTNYGGINYVAHLESFYNNGQIGDACSLNDDIFGLLAEIAAGSPSTTQIKQDVLSFLISKQDPNDGGFGYSAPGCDWYSTSADMTGAAIQSLVSAKNNGLINPILDNAIDRAKNYLLINQNSDGGYGYYGSSDSDTTGWVVMAFNVLDMKDSTAAANTKNWLISQQSLTDGGFLAFDYGLNKSVSNSTTTAQALIGLSGKSWILKIFDPLMLTPISTLSIAPTIIPTSTPSPTIAPTSTATPTPTPTSTPQSTSTLILTATSMLTPTPTIIFSTIMSDDPTPSKIKTQTEQILGAQTKETNKKIPIQTIILFGLGILSLVIHKGII